MAEATALPRSYKIPKSVLVVIYTASLDILLIRRADTSDAFWQSVTGSKDSDQDPFADTAVREVFEETGINARDPSCLLQDWELENVYEIYPRWRHRYAPGITMNTEHVFGLRVGADTPVQLNPREHTDWIWLPWQAAADRCFSPSNAEACLLLPRFVS
ncbi:dihydroneopterin triphosphate diphosphatase [Ottowia thiooxydans]|uniref:dihydroneopterin triphosphate diphosphatase n=1 Tax=Ottowia thiooxydans TaxID=219182 RepID=UPI0004269913|nr:dihydroneopterin triphosphate diphosphatase [Ottowia thiooxydans]